MRTEAIGKSSRRRGKPIQIYKIVRRCRGSNRYLVYSSTVLEQERLCCNKMALTAVEDFSVLSQILVLALGLAIFGLIQWEVKSTEMRAYLLIVIVVAFNMNNYFESMLLGSIFGGIGMVGIIIWNRYREGRLGNSKKED